MNAIKSGSLAAVKGNKGWQIDPEALERWMTPRVTSVVAPDIKDDMKPLPPDLAPRVRELELELAELRGKLTGQDLLIEQLRHDLEHARLPWWRKLIG